MLEKNAPKTLFLEEFAAVTQQSGPSAGGRVWGNVLLNVESDGGTLAKGHNEVYLDTIKAFSPSKGDGTQALAFLCDLADKHGVAIALNALPTENDGLSRRKLTAFFEKAHFKMYRNDLGVMWREPQPVVAAPQKEQAAMPVPVRPTL